MEVVAKFRAPAVLSPVKRSGTHFIGGFVGPSCSGRVRKISSLPGSVSRTVQPLASRYTDSTISAHIHIMY
jgi:hypothetical protein